MSKLLILFVPLFILHSFKRNREIDRDGNPTLRFYGPALAIFIVGITFTYLSYRPLLGVKEFSSTGDASTALSFAGVCVFVSVFFFFCKTILTEKSIITNYVFFKSSYDLVDFERIEDDRYHLLHFSGNRKVAILPFCSGQTFFIERLLALTTQSRGLPCEH